MAGRLGEIGHVVGRTQCSHSLNCVSARDAWVVPSVVTAVVTALVTALMGALVTELGTVIVTVIVTAPVTLVIVKLAAGRDWPRKWMPRRERKAQVEQEHIVEHRRWQLGEPEGLRICLSGPEEQQALELISSNISQEHPSANVNNITSSSQLVGGYGRDLIVLGDPCTNPVAKDVFNELRRRFGVTHDGSDIKLYDTDGIVKDLPLWQYEEFLGIESYLNEELERTDDWYWSLDSYADTANYDYGLVVRVANPFAYPEKRHRIVLFCGLRQHGTLAAVSWFVREETQLPEGDFAAIVETFVREEQGHDPTKFWVKEVPNKSPSNDESEVSVSS